MSLSSYASGSGQLPLAGRGAEEERRAGHARRRVGHAAVSARLTQLRRAGGAAPSARGRAAGGAGQAAPAARGASNRRRTGRAAPVARLSSGRRRGATSSGGTRGGGRTACGLTRGERSRRTPFFLLREAKVNWRMDNRSPICGGQHSLDQSCYAHDQCPYQQQPSMDPLQYEQSQQVNYVMGAQVYREDVDIVPPPTTRKGKEKKVSRRGGGFTKEEYEVLCSAFLNVGKDPITGVNQTLGGYYKRLHDYYNTFKPEGSNRSQLAIQNRWGTIQRSVSKFCGFKSAVDRRNESGKNEQDRIDDAVKIYEAAEPFHFMHCWKSLRNEAKWNDKVLELNNNSAGTGVEGSSQANSGHAALLEGGNENSMPARPEGRDSAKRRGQQTHPHPTLQLKFFNAFTTTGRSAKRKKMNKWFRFLLGKMRN